MLPDWIKTDVYNAVIELQEQMASREQEGVIIISKEQAYFQNNDESVEVLFRKEKTNRQRKILENANKYQEDLIRFEVDPYPDVREPYNSDDDIITKLSRVVQILQQRRTMRDRIKTLVYYYLLGEILSENGQQQLRQLNLSENQSKKIIFKGTRTYEIFKKYGKFQIYNTKYVSVKVLTEMSKEQFDNLVNS